MATDSATRAVTNTLSTTVADTITLTQLWTGVQITNHDDTENLYFRLDGTTAVGSADDNGVVLPGQSVVAKPDITPDGTHIISVVGSGNVYTVEGVK